MLISSKFGNKGGLKCTFKSYKVEIKRMGHIKQGICTVIFLVNYWSRTERPCISHQNLNLVK